MSSCLTEFEIICVPVFIASTLQFFTYTSISGSGADKKVNKTIKIKLQTLEIGKKWQKMLLWNISPLLRGALCQI